MKLLYWLRVRWKLLLRRLFLIDSFCKHCGRDVRDFQAPDVVWERVKQHIKHGNTLCYECFCDVCQKIDIPNVPVNSQKEQKAIDVSIQPLEEE